MANWTNINYEKYEEELYEENTRKFYKTKKKKTWKQVNEDKKHDKTRKQWQKKKNKPTKGVSK
tara:strand:+ start:214 stop:402 length:189 start_codon:yes stop_codon:yes gene_type:complete